MEKIITKILDRITIEEMGELYAIEKKHLNRCIDYEKKIG